jgi:hypothetical protein
VVDVSGRAVPEDFTAFVTTYGRRLATACLEIAGNDRVADAMRTDLLAVVALHWRRWPARWRTRRALARLDRLLRREVRSYRLVPDVAPRVVRMSDSSSPAPADDSEEEPLDAVTTAAWRRAALLRRQWRLGVATAAVIIVALAVIGPRAAPLGITPDPRPTQTPAGVTVLPSFLDLLGLPPTPSQLPGQLALDGAAIAATPQLGSAALPRALAVAEPNRGRLIVVGPDGKNGRVDDPILVNAPLLTTSLSPDGDLIALPHGSDLLVIEVKTGDIRPVAVGVSQPDPPVVVWRGPHTVLVAGRDGAREVDLESDEVATLSGVNGNDVVTVEGNPSSPFTEMVPTRATAAARSLIRLWRSGPALVPASDGSPTGSASPSQSASASPTPPDLDERLVSGPAWIGSWFGPGWSSNLLFVRACNPANLLLPEDVGVAHAAIGAVMPSGLYAGTLTAVDNTQLEVAGFLRAHQLLVAARANGRTLLLAWAPAGGAVNLIAAFTAEVRVSVADLMTVS